jgi:hypothetical protein
VERHKVSCTGTATFAARRCCSHPQTQQLMFTAAAVSAYTVHAASRQLLIHCRRLPSWLLQTTWCSALLAVCSWMWQLCIACTHVACDMPLQHCNTCLLSIYHQAL